MAFLPAGLPLWVPMVAMALVGVGTGAFMNIIVAVAQSAAPRSDTGSVTATVSLVRQVGSTPRRRSSVGVIGAGVAARAPGVARCRDAHSAGRAAASAAVQAQVAELYSSVLAPIFIGLALAYAVGIVAALLLPARAALGRARAHPAPTAAEAATA